MAPWEHEECSPSASRLFPHEAADGSEKKSVRRIVLSELPPHEKNRFFQFLVANKVEFVASRDCQEYSASIRVVKPVSPAGSTGTQGRAKTPQRPLCRSARQGALPQTVRNKEVMKRKSCTLGLLPSSCFALGTAKTRGLTVRYHAFLKLAPPLVLEPKQLTVQQMLRYADETYSRAMTLPARAPPPSTDGNRLKPGSHPLPRSFRQCLLEVVSESLGLPQLVGQCCWGIIGSVEALRAESAAIEVFGRFLDDTYDHNDFGFFLLIRSAVMRVRVRDCKSDKTPGARKDDRAPAGKPPPATGAPVPAAGAPAGHSAGIAEKPPFPLSVRQCCAVLCSAMGKQKGELQAVIATRLDHELGQRPGQDAVDGDMLLLVASEEYHLSRNLPPPETPAKELPMLTNDRLAEQVVDAMLTSLDKRGLDLQELFRELNVNENSPMSPEQLRVLLQEGGLDFSDGEYAALLSRVDTVGSGEIAPAQVTRCLRALRKRYQRLAFNDAKVRSVESADEGEAFATASQLLPPTALEKAADLANSLRNSLLQKGESEVDYDSAFQWALQAVMQSREMAAEATVAASPTESFFGENAIGDVPVEDVEREWAAWFADSKAPPNRVSLLRQAWSDKAQDRRPEGSTEPTRTKRSLVQMPPEIFEQDIEGNVKALLENCTFSLAHKASKMTTHPITVRHMLAEQLAPTVDGMMEALVVDNYPRWLQLLGIHEPGDEHNRAYFEAVRRAFIEVLSTDIDGQRVQRICEAVVATPELQDIAYSRALIIGRSTSVALYSQAAGERLAMGDEQSVSALGDRPSGNNTPRQEGTPAFSPQSLTSFGGGGAGEMAGGASSVSGDGGEEWDQEAF